MRALVAACLLLLAAVGPACAPSTQPTLWYGGDSISNAFMCNGCTVAERLFARAAGLRVLSASVGLNGHTFAQFSQEVAAIPVSAVAVVELGTNDFLQSLPLEEVARSSARLLDRIHAGRLVCLGVSSIERINERGLSRADYDAVIADECTAHGGQFVAIGRALEDSPGAMLYDGVHISQRGHELISQLLLTSQR